MAPLIVSAAVTGWLVGCSPSPPPPGQVLPISRVAIENDTKESYLIRFVWPGSGEVRVYPFPPGPARQVTSLIGTLGFVGSIEVLRPDCSTVTSLPDLNVSGHVLVRMTQDGLQVVSVTLVPASWSTTGPVDPRCGTSPAFLPG